MHFYIYNLVYIANIELYVSKLKLKILFFID